MEDLLFVSGSFLALAEKYIPLLVGGINVLNGAMMFLQRLFELWQGFGKRGGQKGKNKRSTKKAPKNP